MATPYEDFSLWLKSKHGLKAETTYDAHIKESLTSRYIRDALESTTSTASNTNAPAKTEISPQAPISTATDAPKAKPADSLNNNKEDPNKDLDQLLKAIGNQLGSKNSKRAIVFEYISNECFGVKTRRLMITPEIKNVILESKGEYQRDKKYWKLRKERYPELLKKFSELAKALNIGLEPIPTFVFHALAAKIPFQRAKRNVVGYDYSKDVVPDVKTVLPRDLRTNLFPFQFEGVVYGATHNGRILIGDEMGVGKTVQALAISYLYREDWPLLILAPSSLKLLWRDEIVKWLPMIPKDEIEVISCSKKAFTSRSQIYIMSFDMAKNVEKLLETRTFNVAIADEAHYLKSRDAKRTKILSPLLMGCKRVILLSGTPMLARPVEIYNLVHILRPDLFPSFHEFGFRYCDPRPSYFGTDWGNASNTDELHLILSNTVMIRRLKSQVLQELPSKRRQKIQVETETRTVRSVQKILQRWTEKEINLVLGKNTEDNFNFDTEAAIIDGEDRDIHRNIMVAYKLTGLSKIKGICDFLNILIDNETKFILFAHHMEVINDVEEFIIHRKKEYIRIDGSVPPSKRHQLVKKYQEEPECKIALLSLTASSQGVTLTASSTVVFAEMNWTPGIMEQAEDRVHRIGQKNSVIIYYLYADNTLDPMIYKLIRTKNELVAQALDGQKTQFTMEAGTIERAKEEIKERGGGKTEEDKVVEALEEDEEEEKAKPKKTKKKKSDNKNKGKKRKKPANKKNKSKKKKTEEEPPEIANTLEEEVPPKESDNNIAVNENSAEEPCHNIQDEVSNLPNPNAAPLKTGEENDNDNMNEEKPANTNNEVKEREEAEEEN